MTSATAPALSTAQELAPGARETVDVVRRYFAVVADLTSTEEELRALLDPAVRVVEEPNLLTPRRAVRDLDATLAGFAAGKRLLREQSVDVHEVLVDGDRAAVRATWAGTVGVDAGGFTAGTRLVAHMAALLTVRRGRVVEHTTYDCYEPFERAVTPS
jgi:ketosteroid isomerase-like protein